MDLQARQSMVLLGRANQAGFAQMCRTAQMTASWQSHQNPSAFVAKAAREALEFVTGPGSKDFVPGVSLRLTLFQGLQSAVARKGSFGSHMFGHVLCRTWQLTQGRWQFSNEQEETASGSGQSRWTARERDSSDGQWSSWRWSSHSDRQWQDWR